ncbi:MAG: hypothetical protein ER33_14820 [Cyanobium sp. CACIAM 14]|nr:MAG: hypothetical protein ER33_14820 [Cyanobium sp. CACIAM 14]
MTKLSPSLRRRLVVLAVLAVAAIAVALVLNLRHQQRQRRIAACRQQRSEIGRFRKDSFDAQLTAMRRMRLNPDQEATLRRVDREAYVRYVQAFGEQVDKVATAGDRLGEMVDAYRAGDCLAVE